MKRSIRLIDLDAKIASRNLFCGVGRTKCVAAVMFIGTPLIANARVRLKIDPEVLYEPGFWYVILITMGIMGVVVALNFIFKYLVALAKKVFASEGDTQDRVRAENRKADDCDHGQPVLGSFAPDGMSGSGEAENAPNDEVETTRSDEFEINSVAVTTDAKCTFCDKIVSCDEMYGVTFDNYRMPDGSRDSMELLIPCCCTCREKVHERGADMVSLRNNAQIKQAISNGARFSEQWLKEQDRIKAERRMKRETERK